MKQNFTETHTKTKTNKMTQENAKRQALDLIEKARKATTYEYQEYAGAYYSTFEHDLDTLKNIALITVEQMLGVLSKTEYIEDLGKSIKNRELEFWELIKTELDALK